MSSLAVAVCVLAACDPDEESEISEAATWSVWEEVSNAPHVAVQAAEDVGVLSGPRDTYGVIGRIPGGHSYMASEQVGDAGVKSTMTAE